MPSFFEANIGQHDKNVKFKAHTATGYSLFLTATDAVYIVPENKPVTTDDPGKGKRAMEEPLRAASVWMKLDGANPESRSSGLDELEGKINYINPRKGVGKTSIPTYKGVRMEDVYSGIDVVWKGPSGDRVQYDFIVKPGADPGKIKWNIEGAERVSLTEEGDLVMATEFGAIRQQKPFSYQEINGTRKEIASAFILDRASNSVRFEVDDYDRAQTLVIDPTVNLDKADYSTYLGGSSIDRIISSTIDNLGNVYVTGYTHSTNFPTTAGVYSTSNTGDADAFVTKFSRTGRRLVYSTYIGGSDFDFASSIAVNTTGNATIGGNTESSDYPTSAGAYDTVLNGPNEAFVTKLNVNGTALVFSTFLGGDVEDWIESIKVDPSGNVVYGRHNLQHRHYLSHYLRSLSNDAPGRMRWLRHQV